MNLAWKNFGKRPKDKIPGTQGEGRQVRIDKYLIKQFEVIRSDRKAPAFEGADYWVYGPYPSPRDGYGAGKYGKMLLCVVEFDRLESFLGLVAPRELAAPHTFLACIDETTHTSHDWSTGPGRWLWCPGVE